MLPVFKIYRFLLSFQVQVNDSANFLFLRSVKMNGITALAHVMA